MRLFLRVLASYEIWRFLWCQLSWLIFSALLMTPPILLYCWLDKETVLSGLVVLFNVVWCSSLTLVWATMTLLNENKETTAWDFIREAYTLIANDYQDRKDAIIASELKNKRDE